MIWQRTPCAFKHFGLSLRSVAIDIKRPRLSYAQECLQTAKPAVALSAKARKMTPTWARTVAISKIVLLLLIASPAAETNSATKLLELARARFAELSSAEEDLFRAVANGEPKDYSNPLGKDNDPAVADKWAGDRVLRASRIVWLCTDQQAAALVTYHGITVKGARIDEEMDLNYADLSFPLRFFSCAFTDTLSLTGAHLLNLDLGASHLRGLHANWANIESSVFLNNGFKNRGEVRLWGTTVGGNLNCESAEIINGVGNALSCDGAKITGNVSLNDGFKAEGEVRLIGATIGGDFSCDGGQLLNPGRYALSADKVNINGSVSFGLFRKNRFHAEPFQAEGNVSLVGATIGGDLNCSGGILSNPTGSALSCDGASITGKISLSDCFKADGNVSLVGATIGGDLNCSGGILSNPTGSALSCDGARITGKVSLSDCFKADGKVSLVGATIGGDLNCSGGILSSPKGSALSCDGASITGNVSLSDGFKADGGVRLLGATIGANLDCDGGILSNPTGNALSCDGAKITGNIFLNNTFRADGKVSLLRATIGGDLDCSAGILISSAIYSSGILIGRADSSMSCDGAKITGNVILNNGFKAEGEVRLVGATIGEDVNCDSGILMGGGGPALSCDRATVAGNFFLRYGFKTEGEVILVGATIGANLDCDGGILSNPTGNALSCDGAKIMGNVFLNKGFKAEGEVRLVGATIGEDVNCDSAIFSSQTGSALSCARAKITGNVFLNKGFKAEGKVDFTAASVGRYFYWQDVTSPELAVLDLESAKVGVLADDEKSWPAKKRLSLDGLTYDRIGDGSPTSADSRVKWLKLQGRFLPQPYEQLAAVLRKMGHDEQAVEVMIKKNYAHARLVHFPSEEWPWYKGFGRVIAYGYRSWYALIWGLFAVVLGWWVFWSGRKHRIVIEAKKRADESGGQPESHPKFISFIYSLETFVPLVKLGMAEYWMPDGEGKADPKLSARLDFPLWLIFSLYGLPLRIIFYLLKAVSRRFWKWNATAGGARDCTDKFEPPAEGTVLRCYLWIHIIAGWIISTLWVAALTGLVKS